jgi:hypothetical protein
MCNPTGTGALTNLFERMIHALSSTDLGTAGVVGSKHHP